jgi:hypothetical protein
MVLKQRKKLENQNGRTSDCALTQQRAMKGDRKNLECRSVRLPIKTNRYSATHFLIEYLDYK